MTKRLNYIIFSIAILVINLSIMIEFDMIPMHAIRLKKLEIPEAEKKDHFFTFIINSYNCSDVTKKTIKSIINQTYKNFRIIYIDDGSTDMTFETAMNFSDNPEITIIRNDQRKGDLENLYEIVHTLPASDIVVFMKGNSWLIDNFSLQKLNNFYKKYDVWIVNSPYINFATKEKRECKPIFSNGLFSHNVRRKSYDSPILKSFFAGLFQKVEIKDFYFRSTFVTDYFDISYMFPMLEMASKHTGFFPEPLSTYIHKNMIDLKRACHKAPCKCEQRTRRSSCYQPLKAHPGEPVPNSDMATDLIIFSYNRPMQLYALLESVDRYFANLAKIIIIYRTSNEKYEDGYKKVKEAFPSVHFVPQKNPSSDFKHLVLREVFYNSPSPYILFSVDDIIIKDRMDIHECIETLEKTKAYYFSLRLGLHIDYCYLGGFSQNVPYHIRIKDNIIAWKISSSRGDWTYADSLDMSLYRKKDLKKIFQKISFNNPNELEIKWVNYRKLFDSLKRKKRIGLSFKHSKAVNIPLNIVNLSDNPHMHLYSSAELLAKFDHGLKIFIDPLYQIQNKSVHLEYQPIFVERNHSGKLGR